MNKILIVCEREQIFVGHGLESFQIKAMDVGKCVEAPKWVLDTQLYKALRKADIVRLCAEKPQEIVKAPLKESEEKPKKQKKKDDAE